MKIGLRLSYLRNRVSMGWIFALVLISLLHGIDVRAAERANLSVVRPAIGCEQLAKTDLSHVGDAPAHIDSAAEITTPVGTFCKVLGRIEPSIGYEINLPQAHWTQRYLQTGCGGLCGMRSVGITNADDCIPAMNGEFVVASDDMGHQGQMGGPGEAEFAADPQKRIDFAYRANHETAIIAKALIHAFYGRAPRYSYFMGCSDGGREALVEAQRFPGDFDGISAGDPAALFQVQNSFYHAWKTMVDKRRDGTNILMPSKLKMLHEAVIAACDTLSGVKDGLLEDPRTCHFDPAALLCSGPSVTDRCLTAEELAVVRKLYEGATDDQAHRYTYGMQPGSEFDWGLPTKPAGSSMSEGMGSRSMQYVILPKVSPADADLSKFEFSQATFERISELAPLYDATNTNLRPFAEHGGKLILWHGWADTSITPGISIAYYSGVQTFMGQQATDRFMRLFLLAGVGHCGGGEGYDQVDLLTPLMAWTEVSRAPKELIAGKVTRSTGPGGPPPGGASKPYVEMSTPVIARRPVYPYPNVAHYIGKGDPNEPANYQMIRVSDESALTEPAAVEATRLIGPDNQKFYRVVNGQLAVIN